jgi:hypothetical protein
MKKISTFSERIHKEIIPFIDFSEKPKERAELEKRIIAGILGERISGDDLPIGPMSDKRIYLKNIFDIYFEVRETLRRIKLSQDFLSKIPKNIKVPKLDYIRYHYEYYLNEMYMYNIRVNILLDFLIKKCRKLNLLDEIKKIEIIKLAINKAMGGIYKRRGVHVHVKHYKNDKLDQISTLDSLSKDFDFIDVYKNTELTILQKELLIEIKKNLKEVERIFEKVIYRKIGNIIFIKLMPK